MYAHKEADRVPISDSPWGATIERWQKEGLPAGVDYVDYFDLDKIGWIGVDNSPRYEYKVIEETDQYKIVKTNWGATLRNWKHAASTPEFLNFTITSPAAWREAKERMKPAADRVNWKQLEKDYPAWKKEGRWIIGGFWFGFDITHSWAVGTERLLIALVEDPEWCSDMFNHALDLDIALFDMILARGYRFDCISWPDDMGYKLNQFFSVSMYRDILKPVHRRAVEWAHSHGIKAHLHSCGDIRPFIPELVDIGLDALNPLEVKAGMDPIAIKKQYGNKLVLHGGVNAVLWDHTAEIEAEMRRVIPALKENGGYIFSSDHSIPSSVSLADFRRIVALAKDIGKY